MSRRGISRQLHRNAGSEVNVRILDFLVELARIGGAAEEPLLAGLPSVVPIKGVVTQWFDWSDFVVLFERVERALGGPGGFRKAARAAVPTAYPEFRVFAAVFVSPRSLFNFMFLRHMPTSFKNIEVEELERYKDGRIRWRETIPEPYEPSEVFHRGTQTFATLVPLHLGLPEAQVEILTMTPRVAEFVVTLPPADPILTRGRNAAYAATNLVAAQVDEAFALVVEKMRNDRAPDSADPQRPAVAGWPQKLGLSARQRDAFALLVEGRANKDIAAALNCTERNVESHVGRILRLGGVTSRAELLVKVLKTPRDA